MPNHPLLRNALTPAPISSVNDIINLRKMKVHQRYRLSFSA